MDRAERIKRAEPFFRAACDWFEKGQLAFERRDYPAATVARLAHAMCQAAYNNAVERLP